MPEYKSRGDLVARWLVPIVIIGFVIVAIYYTTTFREMPPILKRGIQPADFPQLICGLIIFLTLLMAWFDPVSLQEKVNRMTWLTIALLVGFTFLLPIDLFLALGVFAAGLCMLWGERRPQMVGLVGIAVPFVIFWLFDLVFRIRFPHGLLTRLWYG